MEDLGIMAEGRITLRAVAKADLERIRAWGNDPEVALLIDRVRPISEMEHQRWFDAAAQDPNLFLFAIEEKSRGAHIGNVWLCNIDQRHRKAEVRIFIGDKDFWGKGLGKDAVSALARFAFEKLN